MEMPKRDLVINKCSRIMAAKPTTITRMDSGCTWAPKISTVVVEKMDGICWVWLPQIA